MPADWSGRSGHKPILVEMTATIRAPLRVTVDEDGKTRIRDRYVVAAPLGRKIAADRTGSGRPCDGRGDDCWPAIEPQDPELLDPRELAQAEARVKAAEGALSRAEPVVERARVELAFAESLVARRRELVESNADSKERLEEAEMLQRAQVPGPPRSAVRPRHRPVRTGNGSSGLVAVPSRRHDRRATRHLTLTAPISGQVLRVLQRSATVVQAGSELLELGDAADLEVEVDVLSTDAVAIRPGAKAFLEQWGGEQPLEAVVRLVEPSAFTKISAWASKNNASTSSWTLISPLEQRPSLGDGFRVEARIVLWEEQDVLQAPTGALFRHGDEWAVFVVADGVARMRTVKLGRRNSLAAQILDGLQEGELIILHPSDQVHDGAKVQERNSVL